MSAIRRFFSFQGRSNRLPYWIVTLSVMAALILLGALGLAALEEFGEFDEAQLDTVGVFGGDLMLLVFSVFAMVLTLPITVRRLHDRNKVGWWAILYLVVPSFIIDADAYSNLGLDVPPDLVTLGNVIGYGLTLVSFVDLGLLRGTEGPNRYGPDPLDRDAYDPREAEAFD